MSRATIKTNIVESIDPDQPKHAALANPVDFLFQETLLFTSIHGLCRPG